MRLRTLSNGPVQRHAQHGLLIRPLENIMFGCHGSACLPVRLTFRSPSRRPNIDHETDHLPLAPIPKTPMTLHTLPPQQPQRFLRPLQHLLITPLLENRQTRVQVHRRRVALLE